MDSGADNLEQRPDFPIYTEANWFADGERMYCLTIFILLSF